MRREVLRAEAFPAPDVQRIRMEAQEFTALCPRTDQPDFGRIEIEYEPEPTMEPERLRA